MTTPTPTVTLIRGDGIGPEIAEATIQVLQAAGANLQFEEALAGMAAIDKGLPPLPDETIASITRNKVALKCPLMTPKGEGYTSVNVTLRQLFDLYANLRPVRSILGVPSRYKNVDILVVRENIEGMYSGNSHYVGEGHEVAQAISTITRKGSERIVRYAFQQAVRDGRKKVTLVHKANILKHTSGLFLHTGQEVAKEFPQIAFEDLIVDATAMKLVLNPTQFDVIVTTNLFGDILSDLCAGLVGGLGVAPGANIGTDVAIFEAVHGTAPDIAGKGIANPTALMLSACMMLEHLGQTEQAKHLRSAISAALLSDVDRTGDLNGLGNTQFFTEEVLKCLQSVSELPPIQRKSQSFDPLRLNRNPDASIVHTHRPDYSETWVTKDVLDKFNQTFLFEDQNPLIEDYRHWTADQRRDYQIQVQRHNQDQIERALTVLNVVWIEVIDGQVTRGSTSWQTISTSAEQHRFAEEIGKMPFLFDAPKFF